MGIRHHRPYFNTSNGKGWQRWSTINRSDRKKVRAAYRKIVTKSLPLVQKPKRVQRARDGGRPRKYDHSYRRASFNRESCLNFRTRNKPRASSWNEVPK